NVAGLLDLLAVALPKTSLLPWNDLGDARVHAITDQRKRGEAILLGPIRDTPVGNMHAHDRLRARVIGRDVGFTNRPAAIRNPLARFEVDLIKWPTVTAPMIGCAAEAPQARGLQWKVAQPNILADVQRLGGIIGSDVT